MPALGHQYSAPNWGLSYHERGEDLDLARVEYTHRRIRDHEYEWWQTHVRGWVQDDGSVRLQSHYELESTEYDRDHIDGIGLDIGVGVDNVARALDREGIGYERNGMLSTGGRPSERSAAVYTR